MGSDSGKVAPQKGKPRGKPFVKGAAPKSGRKPGVPNKVTQEFRDTVRQLLDDNRQNVAVWLQQVAEGSGVRQPDPGKALDLLAKLAEFAAPKLGRLEHVGDGGGPIGVRSERPLAELSTDEIRAALAKLGGGVAG